MKLKIILYSFITYLILSCWILDFNETSIEDKIIGIWSLQSYEVEDNDGNSIILNCPFDAATGIAYKIHDKSYPDFDGDGYQDNFIFNYYVNITSSEVHSYYKVDYSQSSDQQSSYLHSFTGLYYDGNRIDSYSINSDNTLSTSRKYISGMSLSINNDILTLSGKGVIKLRRVSDSKINKAKSLTEQQCNILDYYALCGINYELNNENKNINLEKPSLNDIQYKEMILVKGSTYRQDCAPLAEYELESELFDTYVPSTSFNHTISSFSIGKYEVTYLLWYTIYKWAVNNGYSFSNKGLEGDRENNYYPFVADGKPPTDNKYEPVTSINWFDAIIWCNAYSVVCDRKPVYENSEGRSIKSNRDLGVIITKWSNDGYRLPTEGEWQFAATGAGSTKSYRYSGSNNIDDVGWYYGNSYSLGKENINYGVQKVGLKLANELGLYDMTGNVMEWCYDWYGAYPTDSIDYKGAPSGNYKVLRGGDWTIRKEYCGVSYRLNNLPYNNDTSKGFRLVHK